MSRDERTFFDTVLVGTLVLLAILSSGYALDAGVVFLLVVVAFL